MTKAMRQALQYVKRVGVVHAWPDEISDITIRNLRAEGLVTTEVTWWNVHPGSNVQWSRVTDKLSPKGREALSRKRTPA